MTDDSNLEHQSKLINSSMNMTASIMHSCPCKYRPASPDFGGRPTVQSSRGGFRKAGPPPRKKKVRPPKFDWEKERADVAEVAGEINLNMAECERTGQKVRVSAVLW